MDDNKLKKLIHQLILKINEEKKWGLREENEDDRKTIESLKEGVFPHVKASIGLDQNRTTNIDIIIKIIQYYWDENPTVEYIIGNRRGIKQDNRNKNILKIIEDHYNYSGKVIKKKWPWIKDHDIEDLKNDVWEKFIIALKNNYHYRSKLTTYYYSIIINTIRISPIDDDISFNIEFNNGNTLDGIIPDDKYPEPRDKIINKELFGLVKKEIEKVVNIHMRNGPKINRETKQKIAFLRILEGKSGNEIRKQIQVDCIIDRVRKILQQPKNILNENTVNSIVREILQQSQNIVKENMIDSIIDRVREILQQSKNIANENTVDCIIFRVKKILQQSKNILNKFPLECGECLNRLPEYIKIEEKNPEERDLRVCWHIENCTSCCKEFEKLKRGKEKSENVGYLLINRKKDN